MPMLMNSIKWWRAGDASKFLRERGESTPLAQRIEIVSDLLEAYASLLRYLGRLSGKGW
jgi:hypothetical protein